MGDDSGGSSQSAVADGSGGSSQSAVGDDDNGEYMSMVHQTGQVSQPRILRRQNIDAMQRLKYDVANMKYDIATSEM